MSGIKIKANGVELDVDLVVQRVDGALDYGASVTMGILRGNPAVPRECRYIDGQTHLLQLGSHEPTLGKSLEALFSILDGLIMVSRHDSGLEVDGFIDDFVPRVAE